MTSARAAPFRGAGPERATGDMQGKAREAAMGVEAGSGAGSPLQGREPEVLFGIAVSSYRGGSGSW